MSLSVAYCVLALGHCGYRFDRDFVIGIAYTNYMYQVF